MDTHYELPIVLQRFNARDRGPAGSDPQRCIVAYDAEGYVVHVVQMELGASREGTKAVLLSDLDVDPADTIDIGDVDVRPGIYKRMMGYRQEGTRA